MRVSFASISTLVILSLASVSAAQNEQKSNSSEPSHFISGDDRFGQHGEISAELTGRLLLTELSCTACHQTPLTTLEAKGGPNLAAAGTRLSTTWVKSFLMNPQLAKPGTTMPNVLHGMDNEDKNHAITALSAFLSSLKVPFPEIRATGLVPVTHEFWLKGDVENGKNLYHSIGCVACHAPDEGYETANAKPSALDQLIEQLDPDELKELGLSGAARTVKSVPHGDLTTKYDFQSLTHFLLSPMEVRPSGRMPNLKLQPFEAADLAAYLLHNRSATVSSENSDSDDAIIAEGRQLFVELRCANCHALKDVQPQPAKPLASLDFAITNSCLTNSNHSQPQFNLNEGQLSALKNVGNVVANKELTSAEQLQLRTLQLNCYACHERDQLGGIGRKRQHYFETVGQVDIGDEGRLPPSLTHVGQKLQSAWFAKVLDGNGDIRPHMTVRMPVFPKPLTQPLPAQFALADHASNASEKTIFGDFEKLMEPGRQLLNTGCVQCHPLRGESLPSVVGTDLSGVTSRVRPEWFNSFLLNPIALKNRTRMPTFFPNGVSSNKDILKGDVDLQIAAIWSYLKKSETLQLPDKILEARSQNFELVPTDKPIVLRTFMKNGGPHAIAVGFSQKLNIAFDSESCRFIEAWKGKFLDAHATWFNRFIPPAEPLGSDLIKLTTTLSIEGTASKTTASAPQFLGYRLDKDGIPTFSYSVANRKIDDRIAPHSSGGLLRTISIASPQNSNENALVPLQLRLLKANQIERSNASTFVGDNGLQVTVVRSPDLDIELKKSAGQTECLSTISHPHRIEIEVHYQW